MSKVDKLAIEFEKLTGIKPTEITQAEQWADAAIKISEKYHIQVGRGYLILCECIFENGELDGIKDFGACKTMQQVVDIYNKEISK